MINKIFFLFLLFIVGIGVLIYDRIHFDHFEFYSDILDYHLIGLVLGIVSIIYLIFNKRKQKIIYVTYIYLGLLILSLIVLNFIAKNTISDYPKLF